MAVCEYILRFNIITTLCAHFVCLPVHSLLFDTHNRTIPYYGGGFRVLNKNKKKKKNVFIFNFLLSIRKCIVSFHELFLEYDLINVKNQIRC